MARKEQTTEDSFQLVEATSAGFYGQIRQRGERFYVAAGETALWFEPVAEDEAEPGAKGEAEKTNRLTCQTGRQAVFFGVDDEQRSNDLQSGFVALGRYGHSGFNPAAGRQCAGRTLRPLLPAGFAFAARFAPLGICYALRAAAADRSGGRRTLCLCIRPAGGSFGNGGGT